MKKVLKNILKWLICVFLTFAVVFTISHGHEMVHGVYFILNYDFFEYEECEDIIKRYEEGLNNSMLDDTEGEFFELYKQYPSGTVAFSMLRDTMINYRDKISVSLMLSLTIGTTIFLLLDKDKKKIKTVIKIYIFVILISGLIYGFLNNFAKEITLLERWDLSDEYILLTIIAFALVIGIRYIKQKNIANILNEKLKNNNKEKTDK